MKTILQALVDEVHYPVGIGHLENRLIARGLDKDEDYNYTVANSKEFKGVVADCLCSLIEAPNFNEADKSFSLADRSLIVKKANAIYKEIGEVDKLIDAPKVTIKCRY